MIVRHFLLWARTAAPGDRAEAAGALARAYLYSDLSPQDRWEAETAMAALLDDASPLVRGALAEAFANASDAPRHLVVALANDQSGIAAVVLARSPVLTDADLVDCAALGDELVQTAIAMRPRVSVGVAAALAETASWSALAALAGNPGAELAVSTFARIVARHGEHPRVREALIARPDLPSSIRQSIAVTLSETLSRFVLDRGWLSPERMERIARDAREKATLTLSWQSEEDVRGLVAHLRRTGQLTPALMLRALLARHLAFVECALAELADMPRERVAGILWDRRGAGFAPLYRKAGLPASLQPAFDAALAASREAQPADEAQPGAQLSRLMVERVLSACQELPAEEAGKLMALLRRFEADAARDEARQVAAALADEAALAAVLATMPEALAETYGEGVRRAA